eukprot:3392517-Amphidinium_carterae.1
MLPMKCPTPQAKTSADKASAYLKIAASPSHIKLRTQEARPRSIGSAHVLGERDQDNEYSYRQVGRGWKHNALNEGQVPSAS